MSRRIPALIRRGGREGFAPPGGGGASALFDVLSDGTFTRSTATHYRTGAATVASAAINTRAVEDLGGAEGALLSLERGWSQLVPNPRDMATGWTAGTATLTSNAAAGPDGSTLAERIQATSGVQFSAYQNLTGLTASVPLIGSAFSRAVSGTSNHQLVFVRSGADGSVALFSSINTTWARRRIAVTPAATTMLYIPQDSRANATIGSVAVASDIYIDFHNVHTGRYVLRPVDFSGSVGADTLTTSSIPAGLLTGSWTTSIYPKWATSELVSGDQRWLMSLDGANDGVRFRHTGTDVRLEVLDGGSVVMSSAAISEAANSAHDITIDLAAAVVTHNSTAGATGTTPSWAPTNMRWGGIFGGAGELDGRCASPVAA